MIFEEAAGITFIVDLDHLDGVNREANARREGDEVIDRHDLMDEGVSGSRRDDDRARALPGGDETVLAQAP